MSSNNSKTRISDRRCQRCGKLKSFLQPSIHKCPPRWAVWYEGATWWEGNAYSLDEAQIIFAENAKEAAEVFCSQNHDSSDESWAADIVVERLDTGEQFKVEVQASLEWYAERVESFGQRVPNLIAEEIELGEVGEDVHIETPAGAVRATYLGVVSDGKSLAEAMRLMWAIAEEREAARMEGVADG